MKGRETVHRMTGPPNESAVDCKQKTRKKDVLFTEMDGLYTKRQSERKKGKEEKIVAIHEGWKMNGKRASLINKRHFIHSGKVPFWEEFEQFFYD